MVKLQLYLLALGLIVMTTDAGRVSTNPGKNFIVKSVMKEKIDNNPLITPGYLQGDLDMPRFRNYVLSRSSLWDKGVVLYTFDPSLSSTAQKTIKEAMNQIESNTKSSSRICIRFLEKTARTVIYTTISKQIGCHSTLGKLDTFHNAVSIGEGCVDIATIMHELLHTLGVDHEQNRPDRDTYIDIHLNNVLPGREHAFQKVDRKSPLLTMTAYDYGSIMQYAAYGFAVDNLLPTMTPKKDKNHGQSMGHASKMSTDDVIELQRLYQCPEDVSHIAGPPPKNYLFHCSFEEASLCNLEQDKTDDFDWIRQRGKPTGLTTAPGGDMDNGGGYYMLASARNHQNKVATLKTKLMTFNESNYCFAFQMASGGVNGGEITVDLDETDPSGYSYTYTLLYTGVATHSWQPMKISVHVMKGTTSRILFKANIGSGSDNHVSLDQVEIYTGQCMDHFN